MNRLTVSKAGWSRRLIGASAVGAVAAAVSLAGAPSAFAANDYLEFSLDGVTYSRMMTGPIFKEAFQYVPGASAGATIWIRNNSDEPARLSSAAVMVRSDPQLSRQLGLTAGLAAAPGDRIALGSQGTCTDVPQVRDLASGEQLKLSFVVDLSADAPNDTMNRTADFDVVFLLESKDAAPRQACAALSGPSQPPAGPGTFPGNPAPTGTSASTSDLVALSGILSARPAAGATIFSAALPERPANARPPQAVAPAEQQPQAGILPAGYPSTVEPIIRSLSGKLLIAMSVVFSAAVVVRLGKRQA